MADDFDMQPHEATWHRFTRLMMYSAVLIALALILMAIFLL